MSAMSDKWVDEVRREKIKAFSRNPGMAALMSFFMMGLGQIYAGHVDRGIVLMSIQASSLFAGYSIYSRGFVYDAILPLSDAGILIPIAYVFSVVVFLLWIYNIKDAYYLSLFSGFRDWFEVERVLVPMLEDQSRKLLSHSEPQEIPSESEDSFTLSPANGEKVIEVTKSNSEEETKPKKLRRKTAKAGNAENSKLVFDKRNPWMAKYLFAPGVFIAATLVGIWVFRNFSDIHPLNHEANPTAESATTFFSVSAEVNHAEVRAAPSDQPGPADNTSAVTEIQSPSMDYFPLIQTSLDKAKSSYNEGEYASAAFFFLQAKSESDLSKADWKMFLRAQQSSADRIDYEASLQQYLSVFPAEVDHWCALGKSQFDRKDYIAAARSLKEGLKVDPSNIRAHFTLGVIYNELGIFSEGVIHLKKALEGDPLNPEINVQTAVALLETDDPSGAVHHAEKAVRVAPEDVNAQNILTQALTAVERREARVREARQPEGSMGKTGVVLFSRDGQPSSERFPPEPSTVVQPFQQQLVTTVPELKNEIFSTVEPLLSTSPPPAVPQQRPEPSSREKRRAEKERERSGLSSLEFEAVRSTGDPEVDTPKGSQPPPMPSVASDEPLIAANSVEDIDSMADFGMAVAIEPQTVPSINIDKQKELWDKGYNYYLLGEWEKSLEALLAYLKENDDPEAYDIAGLAFQRLEMKEEAFESSQRAFDLGKQDMSTRIRLARLAHDTGRYEQSTQMLQEIVSEFPHRLDMRLLLAQTYRIQNLDDSAKSELEIILSQSDNSYGIMRRVEKELKLLGR